MEKSDKLHQKDEQFYKISFFTNGKKSYSHFINVGCVRGLRTYTVNVWPFHSEAYGTVDSIDVHNLSIFHHWNNFQI